MVEYAVKDGNDNIVLRPVALSSIDANPVGTVVAFAGAVQSGYLLCDGSTFDATVYPELYSYLGSTTLPDYRECSLVGVGTNGTDTIATHDEYTLGQFKDDQLQNIDGTFVVGTGNVLFGATKAFTEAKGPRLETWGALGGGDNWAGVAKHTYTLDASRVARTGTTTHGKLKGVNYGIKAKTNSVALNLTGLMQQYVNDQNYLAPVQSLLNPGTGTFTAEYDGVMYVRMYSTNYVYATVNGFVYAECKNATNVHGVTAPIYKGDVFGIQNAAGYLDVRYFTKRDYSGR